MCVCINIHVSIHTHNTESERGRGRETSRTFHHSTIYHHTGTQRPIEDEEESGRQENLKSVSAFTSLLTHTHPCMQDTHKRVKSTFVHSSERNWGKEREKTLNSSKATVSAQTVPV